MRTTGSSKSGVSFHDGNRVRSESFFVSQTVAHAATEEEMAMNRSMWCRTLCVLAFAWLMLACAGQPETTSEEPAAAQAAEEESFPDPGTGEAAEVEDFVRAWVAERAGEQDVYDIPPRGDHDVTGTLADFHTVHQQDVDTYNVCVDFQNGEDMYDVDFFVDRGPEEGLVLVEHYLHKVNGEAVE